MSGSAFLPWMNRESWWQRSHSPFQRVADIDHTFVDQSLRGQGVAGQLLDAAVRQIRMEGLRAKATCSYAAKWFKEHPDQSDLL